MNHLSFADNSILFTSGRLKSFILIMQTLKGYEDTLGKIINCYKIHLRVYQNIFDSTKEKIKRINHFKHKKGIITYLGFSLFVGRPRISYFSDLVIK